jgi:hypothetical protein
MAAATTTSDGGRASSARVSSPAMSLILPDRISSRRSGLLHEYSWPAAPLERARAADRARSSPARKPSVGAATRGCSRCSTSNQQGLEPFTLPVWLVMNDPGQDPGAYQYIHSVLARRIRGGEYPAGAKLPTETELADEFGCGPDTAARALRALQRDGLARRVLRRGYVSSGPDAHPG